MTGSNIYAEDNTYTINSLRKILQCNRLTADKYIAKGNYKKTTRSYNGKDYTAWIIPEIEIDRMRNNLHYMQPAPSVTSKTSQNTTVLSNDNTTPMNIDTSLELLRNIKELNGRINVLENEKQDMSQEIKSLINERSVLQADLSQAKSKILMIEDKSTTIEGAYSQSQQELKVAQETIEKQQKEAKAELEQKQNEIEAIKEEGIKKDKTIMLLCSVLIGVVVVALTVYVTLQFVK